MGGGIVSETRQSEPSSPVGRGQRTCKVRRCGGARGRGDPPRAHTFPSPPTPAGAGSLARARRPISRAPPPALPRAPAPGLRRLRVGARHKGGGGGGSGGALQAAPPTLSGPTSLTQATGPAAHPQA